MEVPQNFFCFLFIFLFFFVVVRHRFGFQRVCLRFCRIPFGLHNEQRGSWRSCAAGPSHFISAVRQRDASSAAFRFQVPGSRSDKRDAMSLVHLCNCGVTPAGGPALPFFFAISSVQSPPLFDLACSTGSFFFPPPKLSPGLIHSYSTSKLFLALVRSEK